ncbi:unnamed protein product [Diatraea saccharalis]|uniref:Probable RNA polymerase II nuclear localization protein SLC7A6OS n=1 Tax=Diatraea saccharalis TaxID=40085 RepID=A0A9N9QWC4_9NEOP|nr:unnamed protein product [Diatraea saccharalis]
MATSTIIRVKRKIEDNPQDALVLLCKRLKTDTEEISPSLFVFQGTVSDRESNDVKKIVPKNEFQLKTTHNVNDIINKIRKERKEAAQENRYEVINCSRGLKDGTDDNDIYDLVDLQRTSDVEKDVKYAYDLYVAAKQQDFDVSMLDNLVSIENYETNLIFGSHRDNGKNLSSDDEADDEDDSNDENNWRNEYPDTDNSSIDEEAMVRALERCDIDDLSSDAGEDKIYDEELKLCDEDVKRYGAAYAAYKARVLSEDRVFNSSLIQCSRVKELDKESVDGYKDDDDGFYYGQDEDTEQFREQYGEISSDEYSPD